jgi:phage tail tape-measure protein
MTRCPHCGATPLSSRAAFGKARQHACQTGAQLGASLGAIKGRTGIAIGSAAGAVIGGLLASQRWWPLDASESPHCPACGRPVTDMPTAPPSDA